MSATAEAPPFAPGLYPDMPAEEYHADPVPGGSLSCSGAKWLIDPHCPAKFRYRQQAGEEHKATFDLGKAAHRLVLGVGDDLASIDAPDWRGKEARAFRQSCYDTGAVPLLAGEMQVVEDMAAAILDNPLAAELLAQQSGLAEASAFWIDGPSGVWRRARFDLLRHRAGAGRRIVVDYKTCAAADEESLQRAFVSFGYHRQAAWYLDAVRALNLHGGHEPVFVFVCQEKTPPYLVNVVQPDPNAVRIGGIENRRAIRLYAECTATDVWPGYVGVDPNWISLPAWIEKQYEEQN